MQQLHTQYAQGTRDQGGIDFNNDDASKFINNLLCQTTKTAYILLLSSYSHGAL